MRPEVSRAEGIARTTCVRPGCTGTYGPEGYCDECGRKAPPGTVSGPATASIAATHSGSGSGGTRTSRSRGSARGRLGAGLLEMPRVPLRDPSTVVMADPQVAERRRYCMQCEKPVGRSRDGKVGIVEGFCPYCRTPFSFLPRLSAGDVVSSRYEIAGCLAYGGLGWIYLARDRNVSDSVLDRWVVLKGLINTGDADAMAAAVTERRFLVEVDHPNIVKIHDFVQHPDPRSGTAVGYIVMEYVGGQSLRDILLSRRSPGGRPEPLPLPQVLAYGLEVLPALGYLHDRGLLFCDFKPDNVIHAEEQLKIIDLGAVRRADDQQSVVYGTPGYQAPEVARTGPTVASDIYTVGRTLAVLSFDFVGFTSTYAERLPGPAEVPLFAREGSYHRLLRRATHPDPARRFGSAAEMAEQLLGVLREVMSAADGVPRPGISSLFTGERRAFGTEAGDVTGDADSTGASVAASLPLPQVDLSDPGAGFLATLTVTDPGEVVAALEAAPVDSVEVALRLVLARIERGDIDGADTDLDTLAAALAERGLPGDWRIDWFRGVAAIAAERLEDAKAACDAVCDALPGEAAARLALAVAAECTGDAAAAAGHYERVWRMDHGFTSAAFGLARLRRDAGDRAGAVAVLDGVPESSIYHTVAQVAAVRARIGAEAAELTAADLLDAAARLERLPLDAERHAQLAVEVLGKALVWVGATSTAGFPDVAAAAGRVLGHELSERALRFGLERAYRALAKTSRTPAIRTTLVDLANTVRPRTLV